MKKILYNISVFSIPIFLLFTLYGQMCATKVVDIHSSIKNVVSVSSGAYEGMDFGTGMVLIPSSEPLWEIASASDLFKYFKVISDSYSGKSAYKIFSEVEEVYLDTLGDKSSLYTNAYEAVVRDTIEMYKDRAMFGEDSSVYELSKQNLSSSINTLSIVSVLKIIIFVVLLVSVISGAIVLRLRYTNNLSRK